MTIVPNKPSILEADLNDVEQHFQIGVFVKENKHLDIIPELYIDPRRMFEDLTKHHKVDVMTYSLRMSPLPVFMCRRYVVGLKPEHPFDMFKSLRYLRGLHTKLFIGLNSKNVPKAAYIGSQNLVNPSNLNITICIDNKKKLNVLCGYYEAVWNLAKEIKH